MSLYLYSTLKILQNTFVSPSIPNEPESDNFTQLEICYTWVSAWTGSVSSVFLLPKGQVCAWPGSEQSTSHTILSVGIWGAFLRGALVVAGFGLRCYLVFQAKTSFTSPDLYVRCFASS